MFLNKLLDGRPVSGGGQDLEGEEQTKSRMRRRRGLANGVSVELGVVLAGRLLRPGLADERGVDGEQPRGGLRIGEGVFAVRQISCADGSLIRNTGVEVGVLSTGRSGSSAVGEVEEFPTMSDPAGEEDSMEVVVGVSRGCLAAVVVVDGVVVAVVLADGVVVASEFVTDFVSFICLFLCDLPAG